MYNQVESDFIYFCGQHNFSQAQMYSIIATFRGKDMLHKEIIRRCTDEYLLRMPSLGTKSLKILRNWAQ